jgi:uncharacterized protein (UPF0248 family)
VIPIQDLLQRIRWDPAFAGSDFELGYLDHVQHRVVRVPLRDVEVEPDDRFALSIADEDGVVRSIPLHRVRIVWRDGTPIWQRPPPPEHR